MFEAVSWLMRRVRSETDVNPEVHSYIVNVNKHFLSQFSMLATEQMRVVQKHSTLLSR
jgi:hypothetical protein